MFEPTFNLGPWALSTSGSWYGLSLLCVAAVTLPELRRRGIAARHLGWLLPWLVPWAALAAAFAHALDVGGWKVLGYWLYAPFAHPGASFLGGWIGALFAILTYARVIGARGRGFRPAEFLDALAPGILLIYGLGRIGCHLAGHATCCGGPSEAWYAVAYPHTLGPDLRVVPMALVEAALAISLFFGLWHGRRRMGRPGSVFAWHLVLLALERLAVEPWRVNPRHSLGLTQAQWLSLAALLAGLVLLLRPGRASELTPPSRSRPGRCRPWPRTRFGRNP